MEKFHFKLYLNISKWHFYLSTVTNRKNRLISIGKETQSCMYRNNTNIDLLTVESRKREGTKKEHGIRTSQQKIQYRKLTSNWLNP